MEWPSEFLEIVEGIKTMRIRGAGKIGREAARGLKIVANWAEGRNADEFMEVLKKAARELLETRPTAVSLPNSIRYVLKHSFAAYEAGGNVDDIKAETTRAADEFIENSLKALDVIGEIGAKRIEDGDLIITHCNSQAVLSIFRKAKEMGKEFSVIATETRPRFQGHLTAEAVAKMGIPCQLIVDSAARFFMTKVDKMIVGADTIAANGAVVNKIGTSLLALAAHEARVRVYVAAETYKFSPETMHGELVVIEERDPLEVVDKKWMEEHPGVVVRNPAFDVTPPEYIDIIITEKGVIPPQGAILLMKEEFGWGMGEADILRKIYG